MKIKLEDIPAHGRSVAVDIGMTWATAAVEGATGSPPLTLSGQLVVQRTGRDRIEVTGKLSSASAAVCGRCLSPVHVHLSGDVQLQYVSGNAEDNRDVDDTLTNTDDARLDVGWFDGVALDMGDVVCEQLALWEPLRVRCDDPTVTRQSDGQCQAIDFDSGPEVKRENPFAQLANLKLPK